MRRVFGYAALAALLVASVAQAQDPPAEEEVVFDPTNAPLFSTFDVLDFTLEGPLKSVFRERDQESEQFPGVLRYVGEAGDTVTMDLKLATRGKFRLQRRTCRFPPLQLDFPRSRTVGTVFEGQNKVKLVTHCQDRDEYEQYVLQEYMVYRMYNLFTELSFQVRLARVTYIDTEDDVDTVTKYGFLIEHKDYLAARNGWELIEVPQIAPDYFDQENLNIVEVFEYMIGNTDFSAFQASQGSDECCHNTRAIGDAAGPVYSVPYDFDMSGVIKTRYSVPDERFGLRNVRQRLYRGACRPTEDLMQTLAAFNERREAIYELYNSEERLDPDDVKDTLEYLDDFYETINNEGRVRREFEETCRNIL